MSNVNGWQANFQKRCEAVGWTVERTASNHFKVRDAKGKFLFVYPTTPGDKRSMMNVLADAKRAGLENLESRLKLRNERDRLERIEADRASAAVKIEPSAADPSAADPSATPTPSLGDVNGVTIVAAAPAKYKSVVMKEAAPLASAEELLLADGRVVYRCTHDAATGYRPDVVGVCHKTYDSIDSVRTHIAYHSRKPHGGSSARQPEPRERDVKTAAHAEPRNATENVNAKLAAVDAALTRLQAELEKIAGAVPPLVVELDALRDSVRQLPIADADLIDKATRFDVIASAFNPRS